MWWVQDKQLTPAVVATILAIGDFSVLLLEIPTGWFADRFGHRLSLVLGSSVQVAGMLCCWLAHGATGLLFAVFLVALGDAFRSGADQALLFRTCHLLGRAEEFQRIEAFTRTAELIALVGLVLAGGFVAARWSFAAAWIAETVLCAAGCVIACAMTEPPPAEPAGLDAEAGVTSAAGRPILSWAMGVLLLPAAFLGASADAASFVAQITRGGPQTATWLVAAITLAEAAGAGIAGRVPAAGSRGQLAVAAAGGLLTLCTFAVPGCLWPGAIALAFLLGLAQPLRAAAIQRVAADNVRARAASTASAIDMAFTTVTLPVVGLLMRRARR